jgi:hypothetical protein
MSPERDGWNREMTKSGDKILCQVWLREKRGRVFSRSFDLFW